MRCVRTLTGCHFMQSLSCYRFARWRLLADSRRHGPHYLLEEANTEVAALLGNLFAGVHTIHATNERYEHYVLYTDDGLFELWGDMSSPYLPPKD